MVRRTISFKDGANLVPFSEWLKIQKEKIDISWNGLSNKTGVNRIDAYVLNNTKGTPNCPPDNKFKKIIKEFGANESDFEVVELLNGPAYNEKNKESILRDIAEAAIERGHEVIRSPIVKTIGGDSIYHRFKGNLEGLVEEIHKINPERYGHLKYIPQIQRKGGYHPLEKVEEEVFQDVLLEMIKDDGAWFPDTIYEVIQKRLEKKGFERGINSIKYHAKKIWTGSAEKNYSLERVLNVSNISLEEDKRNQELYEKNYTEPSKEWLSKAGKGHQYLVEELARNPNLIEEGLELFAVEYSFEDSWARVDIIYHKPSDNSVLAVEVKQNAVNQAKFNNALKGVEQTLGYRAALEGKLNYCPLTREMDIPIRGMLVAYKIDDNAKEALIKKGCEYKEAPHLKKENEEQAAA